MSSSESEPLWAAFAGLEAAVMADKDAEKTRVALEGMTRDIALLGLFGRNEAIEELPTSSLNFLLLPAFLASVHQTATSDGPVQRLEALQKAKIYFRDFLGRLREYGFAVDLLGGGDDDDEEEGCSTSAVATKSAAPSMAQMEARRKIKIQRFKERQELEASVAAVAARLKSGGNLDDESLRLHLLAKLRWWVLRAQADESMIEQELPMLRMAAERAALGEAAAPLPRAPKSDWKPLILTRDAAQAAVFGKGYPSFYTMSVREYMDMTHHLHDTSAAVRPPSPITDEVEDIDRLRALDEYRDYHRRGFGNTHNKG